MRGTSKITSLPLVALAVATVACGGGENLKPPVPLPHHFDEIYIAKMLPNAQVGEANATFQTARAENLRAEAEFTDATTQLAVARNDLKQTQLAIDSAITQKQAAEKAGEANAINQATIQLNTARELKEAVIARVKFYETFRDYMRRYWLYTQENMFWREAQFELVKSGLAKQNNIQPVKVDHGWFPGQVEERGRRTQHAKERAAKHKDGAVAAHDHWRKIQDKADKDNGKPTTSWDPMAPAATPPPQSGQVDITTFSNGGMAGSAAPPPAPPQ